MSFGGGGGISLQGKEIRKNVFGEIIWNLNFLLKSDQQIIDIGWLIMGKP
jgi:hypothetical protein